MDTLVEKISFSKFAWAISIELNPKSKIHSKFVHIDFCIFMNSITLHVRKIEFLLLHNHDVIVAPPNYNSNDSSAFLHIFNPTSIGSYSIYTGLFYTHLIFGFLEFARAGNCISGWLPDRKLSGPSIKPSLIIFCWIVASRRHWSGIQINKHSWIKSYWNKNIWNILLFMTGTGTRTSIFETLSLK